MSAQSPIRKITDYHPTMENDDTAFVLGNKPAIEKQDNEPFPFFRLPFEIRLLCYRYLVPDLLIPSYPVPSRFSTPDTRTHIRADEQICTPGILAVSKRVHDEVINEFYSRGQFELTIVRRGCLTFDFLGRGHSFDEDNLPSVYYLVKNLKLTIKIKSCPLGDASNQISRVYQQCFFHAKPSALETLQIEIKGQGAFWSVHLHDPTFLGITIAEYLGPLKALRGLKKVTVLRKLEMPNMWATIETNSQFVISRTNKMLDEIQIALDELKELMVSPSPATLLDS